MQIDQPRRDDAVGVHHSGARWQRYVRARRHNATVLHEHRPVFDHGLWHHQRPGQRDRRLLGLGNQRENCNNKTAKKGDGQESAYVAASLSHPASPNATRFPHSKPDSHRSSAATKAAILRVPLVSHAEKDSHAGRALPHL